jgi:hypothetical protein
LAKSRTKIAFLLIYRRKIFVPRPCIVWFMG